MNSMHLRRTIPLQHVSHIQCKNSLKGFRKVIDLHGIKTTKSELYMVRATSNVKSTKPGICKLRPYAIQNYRRTSYMQCKNCKSRILQGTSQVKYKISKIKILLVSSHMLCKKEQMQDFSSLESKNQNRKKYNSR